MAQFPVLQAEDILLLEHNFFIDLFIEEVPDIGPQAFQNIHQRRNGRRGLLPFHL